MLRSGWPRWVFVALFLCLLAWTVLPLKSFQNCIHEHKDYYTYHALRKEPVGIVEFLTNKRLRARLTISCSVDAADQYQTFIVALASMIVAVFTFALWRSIDKLWKTTQTAADAALRQAKATVALESPNVILLGVKLVAYNDDGSSQETEDNVTGDHIPAYCRALFGVTNTGRTDGVITRICLEWKIASLPPTRPEYDHIQMIAFGMPHDRGLHVFLGMTFDPIKLSEHQRRKMAAGESLWVYGFFSYTNFMGEVTTIGFLSKWVPGKGLVPETDDRYAYNRIESP